MFHIGFLWTLAFIAGIIGFIRMNAGRFRSLLMLGTILFFVSGGVVSLIYPLKHYIPMLNKMYIPFKWYPYAVFIIIVYSILVLNGLRKEAPYRKIVFYLASVSVIISLAVALFGTSTSFYTYGEKPYPPLNKGISSNLKQEDVVFGLAPLRYEREPYAIALIHNYGCLYDIKATNFYDPLLPPTNISDFPDNLEGYFSKYGITKAVFLKTKEHVEYWEYPNRDQHKARLSQYPIIYQDADVILYNTNQRAWILSPLVNPEASATYHIIEYDRTKIRAKINSGEKSKWLYHNEYRKGYYMNINEKHGDISSSPDGWCMIEVPAGEVEIEIRYKPPVFWKGVMLGLLSMVLATVAFPFVRKRFAQISPSALK
jgi:hypothetical protein